MKRMRIAAALVAGLVWLGALAPAPSVWAQREAKVPLPEALLDKIPPDLRGKAREVIRVREGASLQYWFTRSPEQLRRSILQTLVDYPEAADFVLDKLPQEPASTRVLLLRSIPFVYHYHLRGSPHWHTNGQVRQVVKEMVESDPDANVVKAALECLRRLEIQVLREALEKRLAAASSDGSEDSEEMFDQLAEEQERWISLERGNMLPGFLRQVPPQFSAKAAGEPVRVVAFGDFGFGTADPKSELEPADQKRVAAAMVEYNRRKPFDFGITLGDNFYVDGMHSPTDPRWQPWWEDLYGLLQIKFYPSLGNHDWGHPDSPAAEILYSDRSPTWSLPAPYYTYTAGPVQFFALDTNDMSEKQLQWLQEELEKSSATWKVVYGHFYIYLASRPGFSFEKMERTLLPILKGRADLYLAGHHHSLQHLKPEGGVHFLISGAGGAMTYPVNEQAERALFARSVHGFTVLEANEKQLTFRHIGADGEELYAYTLRK